MTRSSVRSALRLRLEALEPRETPATLTVTNLNDAGQGSLRDCVSVANGNPDADTIVFAANLANMVINLTTVGDSSIGPSGLFVTTPITIQGSGQTITRSGVPFRLLAVSTT